MVILHWPQAEVPADIEAQILALTESEWPTDGAPRTPRHDVRLGPHTVVKVVDGRVVAALSILTKQVWHRGESLRASGLSAVVVARSLRGNGHGLELVRAARDLIGADLTVFTCDEPLVPFYEAAGFTRVPGGGLIGGTPERPLRSLDLNKVMLVAPHRADLVGVELELYPGDIDRLW